MPIVYAILAIVGFILLILGTIFAAGLILLLVGLGKRAHAKKANIKTVLPKVLIGLSIPLLLIPPALVAIPTVPLVARVAQDPELLKSERTKYTEAVLGFLEAADAGDEEAMYALLGPSAKKNPNIREQIKEFLTTYQGPPEAFEKYFLPSSYWETIDGEDVVICVDGFDFKLEGEYYYCCIAVAVPHFGESKKYGITSVYLQSEKAFCDESVEFPEEDGIYVVLDGSRGYETRRIDGYPQIFDVYDRVITEQEMVDFFAEPRDLDELTERFGEPNVLDPDYFCVYEITREDGSILYAEIHLSSDHKTQGGNYYDEEGAIHLVFGGGTCAPATEP